MAPKKFKAKLSHSAAQGLHDLIQTIIIQTQHPDDDDKLLLVTLNEIRLRLYTKLGSYQKEYRLSFTPAHAIALRLLYTGYVPDHTSYLGNRLHQLSNDIDRWYH